jgi:hypothetical protein
VDQDKPDGKNVSDIYYTGDEGDEKVDRVTSYKKDGTTVDTESFYHYRDEDTGEPFDDHTIWYVDQDTPEGKNITDIYYAGPEGEEKIDYVYSYKRNGIIIDSKSVYHYRDEDTQDETDSNTIWWVDQDRLDGRNLSDIYYIGEESEEKVDYVDNYKRDGQTKDSRSTYEYAGAGFTIDKVTQKKYENGELTDKLISEVDYIGEEGEEKINTVKSYKKDGLSVDTISEYHYRDEDTGNSEEALTIWYVDQDRSDARNVSDVHYSGEQGEEVVDYVDSYKRNGQDKESRSVYSYEDDGFTIDGVSQFKYEDGSLTDKLISEIDYTGDEGEEKVSQVISYKSDGESVDTISEYHYRDEESGNVYDDHTIWYVDQDKPDGRNVSDIYYIGEESEEKINEVRSYKRSGQDIDSISYYHYRSEETDGEGNPVSPFETHTIWYVEQQRPDGRILSDVYYTGLEGEEKVSYVENYQRDGETKASRSTYSYTDGGYTIDKVTQKKYENDELTDKLISIID